MCFLISNFLLNTYNGLMFILFTCASSRWKWKQHALIKVVSFCIRMSISFVKNFSFFLLYDFSSFKDLQLAGPSATIQGLLKIWTEHSHWFFPNWKPLDVSKSWLNTICISLKDMSSHQGHSSKNKLPSTWEVFCCFGRKFKMSAGRASIFGEKLSSNEI